MRAISHAFPLAVVLALGIQPPEVQRPAFHPGTSPDSVQWLGRNAQLALGAAPVLYTLPGRTHLCGVLLVATNATARPIGIDLRSYWGAIYPNQWTFRSGPRRELIDEITVPLPAFTAADTQALLTAFARAELTPLAPGATVRWFSRFNGRCPEHPPSPGRPYLILPLVGALSSSDGREAAQVRLTEKPSSVRDLVIFPPFVPRVLPAGVRVLSPPGTE